MRKILLAALIFTAAQSAMAQCSITSNRSDTVGKLLQSRGWNFRNFDIVCEKLKRANAVINISGDASVLAGMSYGWALLTVADRKTGLGINDYTAGHTIMNTYASQDKAYDLLYEAINEAANNWDGLDNALATLNEKRKKFGASN